MALVSVITAPEGAEYDEATRLLAAMNEGDTSDYIAVLNGVKMVDDEGRTWYGYNFDGGSWWITKSMAAEHPDNDPFEFHEQASPETSGGM